MPAVTHSNTPFASNVFVNGGPTLGGGIADVLGIPDTVGISDEQARSIIEGRATEQAAGNDPDTNEALEQLDAEVGGATSGTTCTGAPTKPAPGSDAATGAVFRYIVVVDRGAFCCCTYFIGRAVFQERQ